MTRLKVVIVQVFDQVNSIYTDMINYPEREITIIIGSSINHEKY